MDLKAVTPHGLRLQSPRVDVRRPSLLSTLLPRLRFMSKSDRIKGETQSWDHRLGRIRGE